MAVVQSYLCFHIISSLCMSGFFFFFFFVFFPLSKNDGNILGVIVYLILLSNWGSASFIYSGRDLFIVTNFW